jgi:CHRD domain
MTKKRLIMAAAIAVGLILTSIAVAGGGRPSKHDADRFTAHLTGYNENPAVNTAGHADLKLAISGDEKTITFELDWADLTGPPGAAHAHFGKSKVNGGVMVFFCGGGGQDACPATSSGHIEGTIVATNVVGPTAQGIAVGDLASVVKAIENKAAYANMHTEKWPTGEIRGQIRDRNDNNGNKDR